VEMGERGSINIEGGFYVRGIGGRLFAGVRGVGYHPHRLGSKGVRGRKGAWLCDVS
jgi:hypothetical protein